VAAPAAAASQVAAAAFPSPFAFNQPLQFIDVDTAQQLISPVANFADSDFISQLDEMFRDQPPTSQYSFDESCQLSDIVSELIGLTSSPSPPELQRQDSGFFSAQELMAIEQSDFDYTLFDQMLVPDPHATLSNTLVM